MVHFCYTIKAKTISFPSIDLNRTRGIAHCQYQTLNTQLKSQENKCHLKKALRHYFIKMYQRNHLDILSASRRRLETTCKCMSLTFIIQINNLSLSQLQWCFISCHFTLVWPTGDSGCFKLFLYYANKQLLRA